MHSKILFLLFTIVQLADGLPFGIDSKNEDILPPRETQNSDASTNESSGFFRYIGDTMKEYVVHPVTGIFGSESAPKKENQTTTEPSDQSKGIFQSIGDTVKEYAVNTAKNMFENLPIECDSKKKKSGKLIATTEGKKFCETRCEEIYSKIDRARDTINTLKNYIPFTSNLKLKPRKNQHLPKFRCALNLSGTKLLCDCPQVPEFSFGKSLKNYLEKNFLEPSTAARDHHHHGYYGYGYPYGGGYGYGYGSPYYGYGGYGGFNPFSGLLSLIFAPLKILFFLVTLPFWIFLIIFLGVEIGDLFD